MPRNSGLHSQNLTDTPPQSHFQRQKLDSMAVHMATYLCLLAQYLGSLVAGGSITKEGQPGLQWKTCLKQEIVQGQKEGESTKAEHAQRLKTFAKGHCRAVQLEGSEVRAAIKRFQKRVIQRIKTITIYQQPDRSSKSEEKHSQPSNRWSSQMPIYYRPEYEKKLIQKAKVPNIATALLKSLSLRVWRLFHGST